jgi:hypothetical protein
MYNPATTKTTTPKIGSRKWCHKRATWEDIATHAGFIRFDWDIPVKHAKVFIKGRTTRVMQHGMIGWVETLTGQKHSG